MKLNNFLSSSPRLTRFFSYLLVGLIFIAGIGFLIYEALDIINLQESVVQYEETLEERTAEINKQLQEADNIELAEENQNGQRLEELRNMSSELESENLSPFQPRLDKKQVREEPKQQERTNKKNILGLEVVGLVINPQLKLAILSSGSGNNQAVREGEIINNWLVKEITGEAIVITPTTENSLSASEGIDKEFRIKMGGEGD